MAPPGGAALSLGGASAVTTVQLASSGAARKAQSADDIMRAIEARALTDDTSNQERARREETAARIHSRINEHEAAYGDRALPRQRLPKVDAVLLDRYQAARHNVLVLGAIQQASQANTHRSAKGADKAGGSSTGGHHRAGSVAGSRGVAASSGGGSLHAGLSSLDLDDAEASTVAGGDAADDAALSPEPSGLAPEPSTLSSHGGRRLWRQGSTGSVASRASHLSSSASALTRSSAGTGRRLRQQHSGLSSSSGGHTLRSEHSSATAASGRGSHHHGRRAGKKKPPKPKPGRVTTALTEFGSKDDWVSKTLLKHALASVIQARWRGYSVRQRWAESRERLVEEEKARLNAAATHAALLQELQNKLLVRQHKVVARAAVQAVAAAEGAGSGAAAAAGAAGSEQELQRQPQQPGPGSAGAPLSAHASRWQSLKLAVSEPSIARSCGSPEPGGAADGSDSDEGWSDVELEDVAAIKFRAVTPPWQKVAEHAHMSAALRQRLAAATAAALGQPLPPEAAGCWPLEDGSSESNGVRLQELRHRRICSKQRAVPLSQPAIAAAAASGLLSGPAAEGDAGGGLDEAGDAPGDEAGPSGSAAAGPLPAAVVEQLLLARYAAKFDRLVPQRMPGRQRWLKLQAQAAAAAAAGGGPPGDELPGALGAG